MALDASELLFSIIFSYMGALEFFFIARNLYHWGFRHHKHMIELSDDDESLNQLQEQIKAAINEAEEKEVYGLSAMKDGVLYKDGFRVSPGSPEVEKNDRQVIGSSRNNLEKKVDASPSEVINEKVLAAKNENIELKKHSVLEELETHLSEQQQEVIEEPFVKKNIKHDTSENKDTAADDKRTNIQQTIRTQFGQTDSKNISLKTEIPSSAVPEQSEFIDNENISLKTEIPSPAVPEKPEFTDSENISLKTEIRPHAVSEQPELNVAKSEDSSSIEPESTQISGFSNQESSSLETTMSVPEMHYDEYDRPEPDGEDNNEPQYSEDYLRSLDGIKYRPLVRDDGTKRRRAFKKRRSSGESSSSRESRASREEELKMFTSLEEEESQAVNTEYAPIRYSSDPNLKVEKQNRRLKKSPIRKSKVSEKSHTSLQHLDEESGDTCSGGNSEYYKEMEFRKRENEASIKEESENIPTANIESQEEEEEEEEQQKQQQEQQPEQQLEQQPEQQQRNTTTSVAMKKSMSPSPTKNILQLSSFEDATRSEHEDAIKSLEKRLSSESERTETEDSDSDKERQKQEKREKRRKEKEREKSKNVSMYETDQKASSPSPARNIDASAYSYKDQTSLETDENTVHDQKTDELMQTLSSKLRRSPRQEDMEYYEEQFIEEEKRTSRTPSPHVRSRTPEISEHKSKEELTTTSMTPTDEEVEKSLLDTSIDQRQAPTIEVDYASDTQLSEGDFEEENEQPTDAPMEGISDFYDFNASVNPSRSKSRSPSPTRLPPRLPSKSSSRAPSERRSQSQSRISDTVLINRSKSREPSPSPFQTSEETSPSQKRSRSMSPQILFTVTDTSGYSDWYDYCVMLNRRAYGIKVENFREAHQSSTDFLMSQLKATNNIAQKNESIEHEPRNQIQSSPECVGGEPKSKENSPPPEITKKKNDSIQSITSEDNLSEGSIEYGTEPPTPQYPRSFSIELKDTERLREEYERLFKRSTYASESLDFSDEFEELREKTRHFRRSRSRSRSPADQDLENIEIDAITRRKLQEKILAQITKTTLDYQDFAKDINREFLDYERRGSDSALIQQKSKILIQFQDNQLKNGENIDDDDMEAEEYHHFRRFSLNLEQQVEEYPDDDYVYEEYIQQIDLSNLDIIKENDQFRDDSVSTEKLIEIPLALYEVNGIDQVDDVEDDQEDSGSDDERQTVVEVDDEIDEDICDFEKSDEFNEQSECEEADREVDRYANRNAGDWKEEGAVGGVTEWDNINRNRENEANIEDMYDDIGEENMEKDYETIIEAMNNEERNRNAMSNGFNDDASIKTEDLLEEILKEDEERYKRLSPKYNGRDSLKRSSQNSINNEKEDDDVPYYVTTSTVIHHNTASTRLRSRYGLSPTPTIFRNFDYEVDDIKVDLNYTPKKEYNWRKNFKIDDDDDEGTTTSRSRSPNDEENQNFLNPRKYSLGGESITIYSRSVESEERQMEIMAIDDEKHQIEQTLLQKNNEISQYSNGFQENGEVRQDEIELLSSPKNEEMYEQDENNVEEEKYKKKKLKKKSRKGSKPSIDDEDFSKLNYEDSAQLNDDQANSSSKKKIKKKKKTKFEVISENNSADFKSPETEPEIKLKSLEPKELEFKTNNSFKVSKSKSPELEQKNIETKTVLENMKQVDVQVDRLSSNSEISNNNNSTINSITTRSSSPNNEILNAKASSPEPENLTRISSNNDNSDAKANSPHLINNKISKSPEFIKASIVQNSETGFDIIKDGGMYPLF